MGRRLTTGVDRVDPQLHVVARASLKTHLRETKSVLFVDDEEALVESTTTMLRRLGYRATGFGDPEQALKYFSEDPDGFDVVIADYGMLGMTGVLLAERLMAVRPDIPIIIMTGYLDEDVMPEKAKAGGIREFLTKPLTRSELSETIRRVLSQ